MIGVDPGVAPNLALVGTRSGWIGFADHEQTAVRETKTKWRPVAPLVKAAIDRWMVLYQIDTVFLEKIGAWSGQGLTSSAEFVGSMNLLEGIAVGMGLTVEKMTPPVWKRQIKLLKTDKDYSRAVAANRWPAMAQHLTRKIDHNRAEAALIAQAGIEIRNMKGTME